jgi:hypothetical protein
VPEVVAIGSATWPWADGLYYRGPRETAEKKRLDRPEEHGGTAMRRIEGWRGARKEQIGANTDQADGEGRKDIKGDEEGKRR